MDNAYNGVSATASEHGVTLRTRLSLPLVPVSCKCANCAALPLTAVYWAEQDAEQSWTLLFSATAAYSFLDVLRAGYVSSGCFACSNTG